MPFLLPLQLRTGPIGLSQWTPARPALWTSEAKPRRDNPDPDANTGSEYPRSTLLALADEPAPELEHPVRKIVFDIESHDQGFSSHHPESRGTYNHSYTWFDAGLERFDPSIECE